MTNFGETLWFICSLLSMPARFPINELKVWLCPRQMLPGAAQCWWCSSQQTTAKHNIKQGGKKAAVQTGINAANHRTVEKPEPGSNSQMVMLKLDSNSTADCSTCKSGSLHIVAVVVRASSRIIILAQCKSYLDNNEQNMFQLRLVHAMQSLRLISMICNTKARNQWVPPHAWVCSVLGWWQSHIPLRKGK